MHNTPAPYRLPLFEELNRYVDLHVHFCRGRQKERLWETRLGGSSFRWKVGKSIPLGPFLIDASLFQDSWKRRCDAYLVGESGYETLFPILFLLLASKLKKTPVIVWSGTFGDKWTRQRGKGLRCLGRFLIGVYRRILYGNTTSFVVYSEKAKAYLLQMGVSFDSVFVGGQIASKPATDVKLPSKNETEYKQRDVVLCVSYLSKRKGIDILIKAFKGVDIPSALLVIAGSGAEEGNLRRLAGNDGRVHFVGHVDGPEKVKWYSLADIFVLPTLHDPWGLVVNEAMHFQLPIITTDAAGCSDIVTNNGMVVPAGNKDALQRALSRLLEDKSLRRSMGRKSTEYISGHTFSAGVTPFLLALRAALNS